MPATADGKGQPVTAGLAQPTATGVGTTESSTQGPARLFAALAKAGLEADAVGKSARNEFHKYDYASAEAVFTEARHALHSNGLSLVPAAASLVTSGDGDARDHRAELVYVLAHASGESMTIHRTWPVTPDRGRPLDKALASALTTALSYVLRDLLALPRVETEVDTRDDREHRPPPKRAPQEKRTSADSLPSKEKTASAANSLTEPKTPAELIADIRRRVADAPFRAAVEKDLAAAGLDVQKLAAIRAEVMAS